MEAKYFVLAASRPRRCRRNFRTDADPCATYQLLQQPSDISDAIHDLRCLRSPRRGCTNRAEARPALLKY